MFKSNILIMIIFGTVIIFLLVNTVLAALTPFSPKIFVTTPKVVIQTPGNRMVVIKRPAASSPAVIHHGIAHKLKKIFHIGDK